MSGVDLTLRVSEVLCEGSAVSEVRSPQEKQWDLSRMKVTIQGDSPERGWGEGKNARMTTFKGPDNLTE
jgi:hypothetical protein